MLCFEIIIPGLVARFPLVKRIIDGRPSLLVYHGNVDQAELMAMRMSVDELLGLLRLKGVSDLQEIQYAILEQNGQLSVFLRAGANPITPSDLDIPPVKKGIAHPLVVQGQISDFHLQLLGYDKIWLTKQLHDRHCNLSDVLFFSLDDDGNFNLIKKEE